NQIAVVRELDGLAHVDTGRPARLVERGVLAAVHDVEPIDSAALGARECREQGEREGREGDGSDGASERADHGITNTSSSAVFPEAAAPSAGRIAEPGPAPSPPPPPIPP